MAGDVLIVQYCRVDGLDVMGCLLVLKVLHLVAAKTAIANTSRLSIGAYSIPRVGPQGPRTVLRIQYSTLRSRQLGWIVKASQHCSNQKYRKNSGLHTLSGTRHQLQFFDYRPASQHSIINHVVSYLGVE